MVDYPPLYREGDTDRELPLLQEESYRSEWRRDYARLIHSPAFRRLQGKTQVFSGTEGDFFRNRLTHSLEVAQIAKSIAIRLNATEPLFAEESQKIEPDLVEFAGLAHDLGHPPFGHNGEKALDECMAEHGGFEGNAQTLRILSRLEKKQIGERNSANSDKLDRRLGLNLTYRSMAAVLKYDHRIPKHSSDREVSSEVEKGYFEDDKALVARIKHHVAPGLQEGSFKTIECSIMDIADDIAYSTYDLEDIFKSGMLDPLDLFALDPEIYDNVVATTNKRLKKYYSSTDLLEKDEVFPALSGLFADLFVVDDSQEKELSKRRYSKEYKRLILAEQVQQTSRKIAQDGYYRSHLTSDFIGQFLAGIEVVPHPQFPQLHRARLKEDVFVLVEILKNITYEAIIRAPIMQTVEYRGKDIVKKMFTALSSSDGSRLLAPDFKAVYNQGDEDHKFRTVCDFIAGMTDRYALEFYSRLFGEQGLTVRKPI